MKRILCVSGLLALSLNLAACQTGANTTPLVSSPGTTATAAISASSEWKMAVTGLQLAWPVAKLAINADLPTQAASFAKQEAVIDAEVNALSTTTVPTNAASIFADVQALVAAVPTTSLSPAHQAELQTALAVAKTLSSL